MKKKAYSLIELSISILIISIIIAGAVTVSAKVASKNRILSTQEKINQIYHAIGVYLVVNGALPCPSSIEIAKSNDPHSAYGVGNCSSDNTGVYASSAASNILFGMVPVMDLGLGRDFAEDSFGTKIAYIVDKNFTDPVNFGSAVSTNKLIIKESLQSGSPTQIISDEVIMAIISYGSNKAGGLPSNVSSLESKNPRSSSASELENDINGILPNGKGNFDNILVASDSSDGVFDDIVFYKTRNLAAAEFDTLHLVKCPSTASVNDDLVITYGTNAPIIFSWPEASYNQIVSSTVACPSGYRGGVGSPTRKCGAFGLWETNDLNDGVVSPCLLEDVNAGTPSNYCSVTIAGTKTASVPTGSSTIACNADNFNGALIPYTCSETIFTPSGSCACAVGFGGTDCNGCAANYSDDGTGCKKDCNVSVFGINVTSVDHTLTQLPLGCTVAGYSGNIAYTCDNGSFNKIGSCSCATDYSPAPDGSCKSKCTIDGVSGITDGTKVSHTTTPVSLACSGGYTGSITYTCNNGSLGISGSCTSAPACTGGSVTNPSTGVTVHTFNSSGTLSCSAAKSGVQILVVGAGGSGGAHTGSATSGTGGGGGGGVIYVASASLSSGNYTETVAGTTTGKTNGSGCNGIGNVGANSVFTGGGITITAKGGGGGGGCNTGPGTGGGSGGGGHSGAAGGAASGGTASGVTGAVISAKAGASGTSTSPARGGGGGGAGTTNATSGSGSVGGAGGQGITYAISGSNEVYGSGGGGNSSTGGNGGTNAGKGSNGTTSSRTGLDAVANKGGGGGGNSYSTARSGDGGSGVVIIRY
jgi:prepilin-type N-terminal cleavage/methylation domain-containing protein